MDTWKPNSGKQWADTRAAVRKSIDTICAAWADAEETALGGGGRYESKSDGLLSPVELSAEEVLARIMEDHPDMTEVEASAWMARRAKTAEVWILNARRHLALLLRLSNRVMVGSEGPFYPPRLRGALQAAARELLDDWPKGFGGVVKKLYGLATTADREWPPRLKAGTTVAGQTVGERGNTVEICVECRKPVAGNAADPIVRIDGRPHHRQPCYNTVYVRRQRARLSNTAPDVKHSSSAQHGGNA